MTPRPRLSGEPSGFRVRVPLAGMPLIHGVRNSGQHPLPSWADASLPPAEWTPPTPTFEDDVGRQRELARLLATLKLLVLPETSFPTVEQVSSFAIANEYASMELGGLWPELDAIEAQAAQRQAWLQRMRAHLQAVAHGELGVRTRRREEPAGSAGAPPAAGAADGSAMDDDDGLLDGEDGVAPADLPTAAMEVSPVAAAAADPTPQYTTFHFRLKGAPLHRVHLEEDSADPPAGGREGAHTRAAGPTTPPGAAGAEGAMSAAGGTGGGGGTGGKSAAARRAAQTARDKAAAAQREREELGEAAGYTSLRIKPSSSINPRQFWSAVDDYMKPLPREPLPRPPPPLPLPDRTALTDRLLAALLPLPADAPPTSAAASGGEEGSGGAEELPAEILEARLRRSLASLGVLTGAERAPQVRVLRLGSYRPQAGLLPAMLPPWNAMLPPRNAMLPPRNAMLPPPECHSPRKHDRAAPRFHSAAPARRGGRRAAGRPRAGRAARRADHEQSGHRSPPRPGGKRQRAEATDPGTQPRPPPSLVLPWRGWWGRRAGEGRACAHASRWARGVGVGRRIWTWTWTYMCRPCEKQRKPSGGHGGLPARSTSAVARACATARRLTPHRCPPLAPPLAPRRARRLWPYRRSIGCGRRCERRSPVPSSRRGHPSERKDRSHIRARRSCTALRHTVPPTKPPPRPVHTHRACAVP